MHSLIAKLRVWSLSHRWFAMCFLGLSLGLSILLVEPPDILPRAPTTPDSKLTLSRREQMVTAGPLIFKVSSVDVVYPSTMRENQTLLVRLNYRLQEHIVDIPTGATAGIYGNLDKVRDLETMSGELNVSLASSGFDVEPASPFLAKSQDKLPLKAHWTVTPKSEGTHLLMLRISEKMSGTFADVLPNTTKAMGDAFSPATLVANINDQVIRPSDAGLYELPVRVYTYWGLPKWVTSSVAAIIALVGFLLSWPIIVELIQKKRQQTAGAVPSDTGKEPDSGSQNQGLNASPSGTKGTPGRNHNVPPPGLKSDPNHHRTPSPPQVAAPASDHPPREPRRKPRGL